MPFVLVLRILRKIIVMENDANNLMTFGMRVINQTLTEPVDSVSVCRNVCYNSNFWHKQAEERVRRLNIINQRIGNLLDSSDLQSYQTNHLSLKLKQSKLFPTIKRMLLMSRLLPYEASSGPLQDQTNPQTISSVIANDRERQAQYSTEIYALLTLEALCTKFVLEMITKVSEDVPFCTEEVQAISNHVSLKFQHAWSSLENTMKGISSRIQKQSPVSARYIDAFLKY